jgi:hypothetical protein
MAGAVTDHLELLLSELHTNQTLRADFVTNPANAIAPFQLTGHERHAVLKRDCDDFVALELVASTGDLPDLFGCPGGGGGRPGSLEDLLDAIRARLEDLLERRPRIPGFDPPRPPEPGPDPGPVPPPGPGPLPGPRPPGPRPTPGPDPPPTGRPGGRPDRPTPRGGGGAGRGGGPAGGGG